MCWYGYEVPAFLSNPAKRFGGKEEETDSEDKRRREQRRLVPSRQTPNHKPAKRLWFGKEETDSEDKRLRVQRRLVPSRQTPNHKPAKRLWFGKEETDSEDKRLRVQRRLVPSRPFPTRLRRPILFRLAGKEWGEKGRLGTFGASCGCDLSRHQIFGGCEHTKSPYGHETTRRLPRYTKFDSSCL